MHFEHSKCGKGTVLVALKVGDDYNKYQLKIIVFLSSRCVM